MAAPQPTEEMLVEAVMHRWPATIPVFTSLNMLCAGCPLTAFCTVREAAALHKLPLPQLLAALAAAIDGRPA